jgi:hypothetical protein
MLCKTEWREKRDQGGLLQVCREKIQADVFLCYNMGYYDVESINHMLFEESMGTVRLAWMTEIQQWPFSFILNL